MSIHLIVENITRILDIPLGGWYNYVKFEWPPLDNMVYALAITRKFSGNPNLLLYRRVLKKKMSPLNQLYFDVVHEMIKPRKERYNKANYLDVTLLKSFDTEVKINLPSVITKHMKKVFLKDDKKGHTLPCGFWLALIFEDYSVLIKFWFLQTVKDIIGCLNHTALPVLMRQADISIQRLQNNLADKVAEWEKANDIYDQDKEALQAKILILEAYLSRERDDNAYFIRKLTQLIISIPTTSSASSF